MSQLKLSLFQLDKLTEKHIPTISKIFREKEISAELFSVQWFITIFAYDIGLSELSIVWDLFLLRGWKFVLQLSLAALLSLPISIFRMESELIISSLKSTLHNANIDIIRKALRIKIANHELREIELQYFQQFAREDLANKESKVLPYESTKNFNEPTAEMVYVFPAKGDLIRKQFDSEGIPKELLASSYKKRVGKKAPHTIRKLSINLPFCSGRKQESSMVHENSIGPIESEGRIRMSAGQHGPTIVRKEPRCLSKGKGDCTKDMWSPNLRYMKGFVEI